MLGNYKMIDTLCSITNNSYQYCTFDYNSRIRKTTLSDESTVNSITNDNKKNNNMNNENIIKENFTCQICNEILYSPNLTKCCGETACYDCFKSKMQNDTCPFCKTKNFRIMPNFKLHTMKEMLIKKLKIKIKRNLTNPNNKTDNVSSFQDNTHQNFNSLNNNLAFIPVFIPLNIINNHNDIFKLSRFFVIKSFNYENLLISRESNKWATTKQNQIKLEEAFNDTDNKFVILIFSINRSGSYQGYAVMTSNRSKSDAKWKTKSFFNLASSFDIIWLNYSNVKFSDLKNLKNPLNFFEPVVKSRDTQELPQDIGSKICNLGLKSSSYSMTITALELSDKVSKNKNYFNCDNNRKFVNRKRSR